MKYLFLVLAIIPQVLFSYSINRGTYGEELHWENTSQRVYLNTANSSLIGSSSLSSIINTSNSEFSSHGFTLTSEVTSAGPISNRNDVYFTNDTSVFSGSSVLGITKVSFEQSTGKIVEADILINDSVFFSSSTNSGNYIGDILTHELGHLIGLGHSQVHSSTMFYSLANGQDVLDHDDIAAVKHLYSTSSSEITGKVIGGSGIGIFGAHVQAISSETGEVKSAAISESDGSFIISGLSQNDTYYLYIEPLEGVENFPSHYGTVRDNFCLSESRYRGTFFQSCRRSDEGKPQGVATGSSSSISVGNITIGCDLSVPVSYMQNKSGGINEINIIDAFGNAGDALTGYFSEDEVSSSYSDEFEIDLSNYTVPSGDIYLDIKLVYQKLYSPMRLSVTSMTETVEFDSVADGYGLYYDSDGNPDLDVVARIKLDSTPSNNVFKFKVTPEKISDFIVSKPFTVESFFPSSSEFLDEMNFYLMIMTVSKKELGVFTKVSEKSYNFQDNSSCIDAPQAYSVSENSQTKSSALEELEKRKKQQDPEILSCGTVSGPGGPPSGASGFLMAFMIGAAMACFPRLSRVF